jgi:phospholipase/carboxylesterase
MKQLSGPSLPPLSGNIKRIVVLLHGVGANGDDLIGLAPLMQEALPDTLFIAPNAPEAYDLAPFGYQWFSLRDRNPMHMLAGVQNAAPILNAYVDSLLQAHTLSPAQLALVGFSQGTMTGLYSALRRNAPIAGMVGFSGAMIGADVPAHPFTSKPPICLIHGEEDSVVPFSALAQAKQILSRAQVVCETHARPHLGHSIDPEGIAIALYFLRECFGMPQTVAA